MDPELKQRLVGAAVLVALAVLFIPTFLQIAPSPVPAAIPRDIAPMPAEEIPPEVPSMEPLVVTEIDHGLTASPEELAAQIAPLAGERTDLAAVQATVEAAATTDQQETRPMQAPIQPVKPSVTKLGAETGLWTIQLGSFASEDNARGLLAKLRSAGFEAFLAPLEKANKRSFRVRVGATSTRQEAERLHAHLAQSLGYAGMVVRNE
ncbi:MAG: SPOR domain-containing protein [Gammaproteobacteria bacterium]|nr:SPOR domain-containing protein [Gammaproteobacteria bacterium]